MKVQIIIPQCRKTPTNYPPYGAVYIGTTLKNNNHEVDILNLDLHRYGMDEVLDHIAKFDPDIIGFSAIVSTSYWYIKELSRAIKKRFPNIMMVLGGQLSNAAAPLLQNTPIDVIIIGEGERTIIRLLDHLGNDSDLEDIKGIAFHRQGEIVYTPPVDQIKDLDSLAYPDFELIDMKSYLVDPKERWGSFLKHIEKMDTRFFEPQRLTQKAFTIMTGRGCHARCTFCCRNTKGLRKHSAEYVLDLMGLLKEKYNVGYFTFGDESFIYSKKWTLDFLEKLKKRKLDILFYVLGARVDIVDKELLFALKDAGCFMIEYGFESGSQRMLDMMEKRTTVAENYRVFQLTREAGLHTVPAIVLNMPGETPETIQETILFLKSLQMDRPIFFSNYAQAHPGTPLYEYAILSGLIKDEDQYLSSLTDVNASDCAEAIKKGVFLNFSNQPLSEVLSWQKRLQGEVETDMIKRQGFMSYLNQCFLPRVGSRLERFSRDGIMSGLRYYYPRLKHKKDVKLKKMLEAFSGKRTVASPSNRLKQVGFISEGLISEIKKRAYSSREISQHPFNKHIDCYTDSYDGQLLVRYPSLRDVCRKMNDDSPTRSKEKAI